MQSTPFRRKSSWAHSFGAALLASLALLVSAGLVVASVGLVYFRLSAGPGPTQITVEWQTETESDVVAFRVKRGVNPNPANAVVVHTAQAMGSATSGATYAFVDAGLTPGAHYYYWLLWVSTSGQERSLASANLVLPGGSLTHRLLLPVLFHSS